MIGSVRAVVVSLLVASFAVSGSAWALEPGESPPAIGLLDLRGQAVDLKALRGKVVVIDFWASWCAPCTKELPFLEKLYKKHKADGLVIVGVNIDKRDSKMKDFLKRSPVTFRVVHDKNLALAGKYEPSTMPSSYFVARDGKLRRIHRGFKAHDKKKIEALIDTLLSE